MPRVSREEFDAIIRKIKTRRSKRVEKRRELQKALSISALPRKRVVAQLDAIFSILVRMRGRALFGLCPFDCTRPIECCFHFVTRSKYATRWDLENAVGSCYNHNYEMEYNPHQFVQWYIRHYGQATYDALLRRSNKIAKFSNGRLLEIKESLRRELESVSAIRGQGV